MNPLLIQTAANVLNEMMRSSFFSICEVKKAADILGHTPVGDAYATLQKLHCVHWHLMPKELRDSIPQLITEALGTPAYQFEFVDPPAPVVQVVDVTPKPLFLRLLGGKS